MLFLFFDWLAWEEYLWRERLTFSSRLWQRIVDLIKDLLQRLVRLYLVYRISVCPV